MGEMSHCQLRWRMILYLSPFRVLGFPVRCENHSATPDMTRSNHNGALMWSTPFTPNSF